MSMKNGSDETLFLRLLLMHGGDPEPLNPTATDIYNAWCNACRATLVELGFSANTRGCSYDGPGYDKLLEYETWLIERGLGYDPEHNELSYEKG